MREISEVAGDLQLTDQDWLPYGQGMAKIRLSALERAQGQGRLVLVTAMSPHPAGEGKTTVAIGLADALRRLGVGAALALRQPSMGPVFGRKGGATGAGRAQLAPSQAINLHFTGDFHAVTQAHNLLAAALDSSLFHGNPLAVDIPSVTWPRVLDLNERCLRRVVVGEAAVTRSTGFAITAASEIMAVLALARDWADLRRRLGAVVVGADASGRPVTAEDLKVAGAMAVLLRDALQPNLVQTLEGSPAIVHCGPFANLAHGTSSLVGTRLALQGAEVVLQEAGFGADLGGEKFLNLFCPRLGQWPVLAVMVMTLRGVRHHGLENALHHLARLQEFALPSVGCLNLHPDDSPEEASALLEALQQAGHAAFAVDVFRRGGAGALELAEYLGQFRSPAEVRVSYRSEQSLTDKIAAVACGVYGASTVNYAPQALEQLARWQRWGFSESSVCMAKTQYSLSHDPALTGVVKGLPLPIREVHLRAGAGFVVPVTGELSVMPGLPSHPNFEVMDLEADGTIRGLGD